MATRVLAAITSFEAQGLNIFVEVRPEDERHRQGRALGLFDGVLVAVKVRCSYQRRERIPATPLLPDSFLPFTLLSFLPSFLLATPDCCAAACFTLLRLLLLLLFCPLLVLLMFCGAPLTSLIAA